MAQTFTATYRITLNTTNKDHSKGETVAAYIVRTSPSSMSTTGVSVVSATINMSGTTFWSGSGNNPYLDFGSIGRVGVSTSISDKTAISITAPSGFSLNNLLSIGTSSQSIGIYAYKSTSGNVVTYSSTSATLTITATCTQSYTKSTATVTSSVDAGSLSTVTFSNSNLAHVYHTVLWKFGASQYSITGSVGADAEAYTIPVSWLANIPNELSGTAEVTVTTFSEDDVNLGSNSYSFTITAPSSAIPTISLASARIDNTVPSAWGIYVQGKSGIRITATAAGYQGSTITSYAVSGGAAATQTSNVFTISPITESGTVTYTVKATDSRGRTASASVSISVTTYTPPSFTLTTAIRCTSAGTASETGTYIKMTATRTYDTVGGRNTCALTGQYGLTTSSAYSSPVTLTSGTASIQGSGTIDINASYRVRYTITDAFSSVEKIVYVGTAAYTVFFRRGGNGVAFGKVSERENAVEINGDWGLYHGDVNLAGTVPVSRGGTGATTVSAARNALGLGNTSGAVPIANGGTGQTTVASARSALGLGNTTGAVPVENGGTGATDAAAARSNLGVTLSNLGAAAASHNHAASEITSGTLNAKRLPFVIQKGSISITGVSWSTVTFSTEFSSKPIIVVSYANNASSSNIQPLKTQNESTTGFQVCMAGSSGSGTRRVNWIAVGS